MTAATLPPVYQPIYEHELDLLVQARATLAQIDLVEAEDRQRLADMIEHLDDLFMLVVVGEFNSGKSSLINALLQDDYLDVGVLPTTARINIIRRGRVKARRYEGELLLHTHPAAILENLSIVDTPGTNAVFREHERLARQFIHRSDLIFFVMAATHAFAETDRLYLELIRAYGTKVVILLNQIDVLDEGQLEQVIEFVGEQSTKLLDLQPEIIPVSARWAQESRSGGNLARRHRLRRQSNVDEITGYVRDTLGQETRLQTKLRTPLRVLQTIVRRYDTQLTQQLEAVQGDTALVEGLEREGESYRETVRGRIELKLDPIDRIFEDMYRRGRDFIDENLQVRRLSQLLNWADFQATFEKVVVGEAPKLISDQVDRIVAEMIAEDRRQWEETLNALHAMLARHQDQVVGSLDGDFSGSVQVFEENVLRAERALARYSKREAADHLRNAQLGALSDAVMIGLSGLLGGGGLIAFGVSEVAEALAAIQSGAAASALLGPVGWALGGAAALGGAYVLVQRRLPRARQQTTAMLRSEIDQLRNTFREALLASATEELYLFRVHVSKALQPLQRYLTRLEDELLAMHRQLGELDQQAAALQQQINALGESSET